MRLGRRLGGVLGRRGVDADAVTDEAEEPCIPCGDKRGVRQFSLNPPPPRVITDDQTPNLLPGRLFTVVDGQVLLFDPVGTASQILNPGAAMVWAEVDGRQRVGQIIDRLVADTGADRTIIAPDVRDTLGRFVDLRVITFEPDLDLPIEDATGSPPATPSRAERWAPTLVAALDRRTWPSVFGPLRASGIDAVVRTDDPALGHELGALLAALPVAPPVDRDQPTEGPATLITVSVLRPRPGSHVAHRLYLDGRLRWTNQDPDLMAGTVLSDLTDQAVAGTRGRLRFHAGAVERDGQVVVITGDSGRGKSTLTAALVQRGWAYLTDELAAVDPASLDVATFPKPIDLDLGSRRLLGLDGDGRREPGAKRPVTPTELGSVSTGGRLALLVVLDDEIEAGSDTGADASPEVRAVLDLIGVTFGPTFEDELALDQLADLAGRVPILRLPREPLESMATRLESAWSELNQT
jgi:hypothetical protein